jgi:hypothetical protein
MTRPEASDEQEYLYLTTRGRKTGRARQIEIWFTRRGRSYSGPSTACVPIGCKTYWSTACALADRHGSSPGAPA